MVITPNGDIIPCEQMPQESPYIMALFFKCSDFWIATGNENIGHLKTLQKVYHSPIIASFFKEHSSYSDSSDYDHYTLQTEPILLQILSGNP